jgi:hypothetical protein
MDGTGETRDRGAGRRPAERVVRRDCDDDPDAELVAVLELTRRRDPEAACAEAVPGREDVHALAPFPADWRQGDRTVRCLAIADAAHERFTTVFS